MPHQTQSADVLHFLFQVKTEAAAHAGFQIPDERAQVGGGAAAGVIDKVGVIVGTWMSPRCVPLAPT